MTAADLHRFFVVSALVSDLYCPGYNPKQPLAKDSNLGHAASRYKIDAERIAAAVRLELSKTAKPSRKDSGETKREQRKTESHRR